MKKTIKNLKELRAEIRIAKRDVKEQEESLLLHLRNVRESLKPKNILLRVLSSVSGIQIEKSTFFKNGISFGLSLFLQRFIFKTEKNVERKIYHWLDSLFDGVKSVINKFSHNGEVGSEKIEDRDHR